MKADEKPATPTKPEDFRDFVRKIISVPKAEIDRREKAYQAKKKQRRR